MIDITLAEQIKAAGYSLLFVCGDVKEFNKYIDSLVHVPETIVAECANFDCPKCGVDTYWEYGCHMCHKCPECKDGWTEYSAFKNDKLWGRRCEICGYEEKE